MKNIKLHDLFMIFGVLMILLINPLTGQYLIQGVIAGYEFVLGFSDYVMIVGLTLVAIGYMLNRLQSKKDNIAKLRSLKRKKTSKGENYLTT